MRTALLVGGVALLAVVCWAALTPASPDDGIDHGGNPCSAAIFEALGIGSDDEDSAAMGGRTGSTEVEGTIEHCQRAARRRLAVAAVPLAAGIAALVAARRVRRDEAEAAVPDRGGPGDES